MSQQAHNMQSNTEWFHDAVVYQIYPRSFKDTTGNGIGDLEGVIRKLNYLNDGTERSLGVNAIWISPVYPSPMADFGYDVCDYRDVDPLYGDLDTFDRLVEEAHARGIRIILDFVPNHTSDQHPAFKESRSSRDNPKRDWYIWRDPAPDGGPPNNWISRFGGSAWEYDEATGQYYFHQYLPSQPDLNWRNPEVQEALTDVMRFWLDRGVDGFRVDVINRLVEDDDMKDEPINPNYQPGRDNPYNALLHTETRNQPETLHLIDVFCAVLKEYGAKYLIGEARLRVDEILEFYGACTNGRMIPFNFNFMHMPWNAESYRDFVEELEEKLGGSYWPNYVLGNHDQPRVASRIGQEQARVAAMLLLTLRGTPFIYYGEEIGMEDVPVPFEQAKDPWDINMPGLGLGRDAERTPMQWNDQAYAGFSSTDPWLPVADDYQYRNVAAQDADPRSTLSLYRTLIHYRQQSSSLKWGTYQTLLPEHKCVYAYERISRDERHIILLNFTGHLQYVRAAEGEGNVVASTLMDIDGTSIDLSRVSLRPHEGILVRV